MFAALAIVAALGMPPVMEVQQRPSSQPACTQSSPCVGPRGGVYYITPSGARRYLPRR